MLWIIESLEDPKDREFIENLYIDYCRLMFATAKRYTSNPSDQEDIVQSTILKLIRRVDVLRKFSCCVLPSYIVYTVRSVAVDFLRAQGRFEERTVSLDDDILDKEIENNYESLDAFLISKERAERLKEIWPKLPEEDQLLLEGRYIWGYTDKELAEDLHCKPDSIRMKLTRARRRALNLMTDREEV